MSARRTLVVGLPHSGKTTFIGAFWHVVEADEIASSLRVKDLVGDRTELNKLRALWLQCKTVGRTSRMEERTFVITLADRVTNAHADLVFPDMSGESFSEQWAHREWTKDYDQLVEAADAALVFVHPSKIVEPLRIDTVNELAAGLPTLPAHPEATMKPRVWDPIKAPTQVQLVDLLQFIAWRRPRRSFNVGLVVSAWDLLRELQQTPREWCRARLPLLMQYLNSNSDKFSLKVFGVSAQGGELPRDATRLKGELFASNRIEVIDDDGSVTKDITLPVKQLAFESQ